MLASFAAHLAQSVRPVTVSNYIAAVRNLHIESGMEDPTVDARLLPRVLRGIKRAHGTAPVSMRLPITNTLVRTLVDQLGQDRSLCSHDRRMFKAALLLAFNGFLRCAEFTSDAKDFDPRFSATRSSITIAYHNGKPVLEFLVKRSKTDPYARGMKLYIGSTQVPYCPVVAMIEFLPTSQPQSNQPLFVSASGVPLSRSWLTSKVRSLLLAAGIANAAEYSGHSFRIGAATSAAAAGAPEWQIRAMGRWKSDCVLRYIRCDPKQLCTMAALLEAGPS